MVGHDFYATKFVNSILMWPLALICYYVIIVYENCNLVSAFEIFTLFCVVYGYCEESGLHRFEMILYWTFYYFYLQLRWLPYLKLGLMVRFDRHRRKGWFDELIKCYFDAKSVLQSAKLIFANVLFMLKKSPLILRVKGTRGITVVAVHPLSPTFVRPTPEICQEFCSGFRAIASSLIFAIFFNCCYLFSRMSYYLIFGR